MKGVCPEDERLCSYASRQSGYFRYLVLHCRGSEDAADRVERAIYDACAFLADGPLRGHTRRDLTPRPIRFWTLSRYPNYTVVYRPETAPVQIIAVLHGKRNIRRILKRRP